jgi:hypothetical protein
LDEINLNYSDFCLDPPGQA